jgi:hypothetical protein
VTICTPKVLKILKSREQYALIGETRRSAREHIKHSDILIKAQSVPQKLYRIYDDINIIKKLCEMFNLRFIQPKINTHNLMITSLNNVSASHTVLQVIASLCGAYGGKSDGNRSSRVYFPCYANDTLIDERFVFVVPDGVNMKVIDETYPSINIA